MGSVAILCKLRNGNAYSGMEHWGVLQHTIHSKGGPGELHKGGGKGKLPTAFDVPDCRSCPQRKGSCKGDPLAKNKQCQCLCETSAEGAAKRCRHKPRRRHECSQCHTLVCTGYCWNEHLQMCHLCLCSGEEAPSVCQDAMSLAQTQSGTPAQIPLPDAATGEKKGTTPATAAAR